MTRSRSFHRFHRWTAKLRRRALRQRQHERQISQRIHNSERDLTALLDQVQQGGETPEAKVFARLLQRREADLTRPVVDGDEATPASLRRQRLAERLELVLDTARALALLDPITNLPNRNYFLERLNWESERSRREGRPLALLFINIDKFKELNETYGHNTGDSTLQHVASELLSMGSQAQ